jgi:hypothetical protein
MLGKIANFVVNTRLFLAGKSYISKKKIGHAAATAKRWNITSNFMKDEENSRH